MQPQRYTFDSVFTYNQPQDTLMLNFNTIINGVKYPQGTLITRSNPFIGGLNPFNYIGRSIAGTWDLGTRTITISGFYY